MKYIRTKDGIYEVVKDEKNLIYKGSNMIAIYDPKIYQVRDIYKDEILKSADAIKDLCDVFVFDGGEGDPLLCTYEELVYWFNHSKE